MAKIRKRVTPAQILAAIGRDVSSGRPDAENDVVATIDAMIEYGWVTEKVSDWWLNHDGRQIYRDAIKAFHGKAGADTIEIEVEE